MYDTVLYVCSLGFFYEYVSFVFRVLLYFIEGYRKGNRGGRSGTRAFSRSLSSKIPRPHSLHRRPDEAPSLECVRLPSLAFSEWARVECGSSVVAFGPAPTARHVKLPVEANRNKNTESTDDWLKKKATTRRLDARLDARHFL